ncbi:MAG TPA: 30S ribosomal protein S3 [bacterium]|nr:30S ribosomal protein S3 [bacterium]
MGQKVIPTALRLGYIEGWRSNWFQHRRLGPSILEDYKVRAYLQKRFPESGITRIDIDRLVDMIRIKIRASRPGLIIGRKGAEINNVSKELQALCNKNVTVDVSEVTNSSVDAAFLAQSIAQQISRRGTSYRFVCKNTIENAMQRGANGVKIKISGRLAGAEISRSESYKDGTIPLHTLSAIIDYAQTTAHTTYGAIGVKVWLYRGDAKEKA